MLNERVQEQVNGCLTSKKSHGRLLRAAEQHQWALPLGSGGTPGIKFLWAWREDLPHCHRDRQFSALPARCHPVAPLGPAGAPG